LAFHWFVALIPGAIALVGAAHLVGLSPARLHSLTHGISVLLPASSASALDSALETHTSSGSSVFAVVIGGLVALWASLEAATALQIALDMAYETKRERSFLRKRIRGLALIAVTILFGGGAFCLLIIGESVGTLIEPAHSSSWFLPLWTALRWLLGIACVVALISLYDLLGPDRTDRRWKLLSIGGVASTAMWLLVAVCYSAYLNHDAHTAATYGQFAGVVALLLWLYFAGVAILLGAELNREVERLRAAHD
jgi:membrane protein